MNTVKQAFDSRAMPLLEPSTAPIAFWLWDWLVERFASRDSSAQRDGVSAQSAPQRDAGHSTPSQTPR